MHIFYNSAFILLVLQSPVFDLPLLALVVVRPALGLLPLRAPVHPAAVGGAPVALVLVVSRARIPTKV